MLLRVAAVAGASALAGACSSSSAGNPTFLGSMGAVDTDSGADAEGNPGCANGCGSIALPPPDASPDAADGRADADASLPCGTGVCGSIVMPQDAASDSGDAAHD